MPNGAIPQSEVEVLAASSKSHPSKYSVAGQGLSDLG